MTQPIACRDAATLVCLRATDGGGYEVLLTKRPDTMRFMGGMWVFPGGAYDASDPNLPATLSPAEALAKLGERIDADKAAGLFACAIRELWEEVGILLAVDAAGRQVDQPGFGTDIRDLLTDHGWRLATDQLVCHGRAITPPGVSPIRFDARYFLATVPRGCRVRPDPREVSDAVWLRPADAIAQGRQAALRIPVPTMAILQGLSETPGLDQVMTAVTRGRHIDARPLSPLVTCVLAPNPGIATGPGTNTYIVGDGETVIVDPAIPDAIFLERVVLEAARAGAPVAIVLTHLHPDHVGGAWLLAAQLTVPIFAWHTACASMAAVTGLFGGEILEVGGGTLRVMHTPGHASQHISLLLEPEHAVLCGDVVAGFGTVVIPYPDGDMGQYVHTLRELRALSPSRLYPGHGPVIDDAAAKLDEYIDHRLRRESEIIEVLRAGPATAPEIVRAMYADIAEVLWPMAELSVAAHLAKLESEARVKHFGDVWRLDATVDVSHAPNQAPSST